MEWEFPWKSHGNGSSFRASDGNGNDIFCVRKKNPILMFNVTTLR